MMEDWRAKLHAAGIPAWPIPRLEEVCDDPQCAAREISVYDGSCVAPRRDHAPKQRELN